MKLIYTLNLMAIGLSAIICSCSSPEKKVEKAQEDLAEARQEQREERKDSIADYEAYKLQVEQRIADNDARIAELRVRLKTKKGEAREEYRQSIDRIEEKNKELKKEIGEYDKTNQDKWENFKIELNHDLDGIGESLRDLGRDNK